MLSSFTKSHPRKLAAQLLNQTLVLSTAVIIFKELAVIADHSLLIVIVFVSSMNPAIEGCQ